ncbi:hypothetical protein F5Y06DRAFT_303498 [Hypoxylon sp. FL0890]|nr:hypothetical protein F5Y06DRAFT_303498 [Hypoxylon sp. FL0890]
MKLFMIFFFLGLPGVALTSQLDVRQGTPSGNTSVTLPSQSLSSSKEPAAPSLVASSTGTTTPSNTAKQERGPQGPDVSAPPGPPLEPVPAIVTPPVEVQSTGGTLTSSISTSTAVEVKTTIGTTTLAISSPIITAPAETPSAELTTIAATNSLLVGSSSSTTLITSKTTASSVSSTPSKQAGTTTISTITSSSESVPPPTKPGTMSDPTPTSNSVSSNTSGEGTSTLTIALSTVLSVIGVILIAVAAYFCTGGRRKRLPLFNRGITPIGDEEIATWKSNRPAEKVTDKYTTRPSHSQNPSTATSTKRAPSVIQYQNGGRPSLEVASPRSFIGGGKYSFDLPQAPGAVLARAPNARSGLTDETVPGDDPFLPSPRRNPSRLHKSPPNPSSLHGRTKGSRSSSMRSFSEAAWRDAMATADLPPHRASSDAQSRSYTGIYSNPSIPPPPRLSFGENEQFTGLSPPPSRRNHGTTIGLAVG